MKKQINIPRRCRCSAFTLLELLVVIAIIGVLAAMIIPAVGGMYEKGRMVQCVNNLKQLHTAAVNYASAHDGNLPFPATEDWRVITDDNQWGGHHKGWVDWYSGSNHRTYWWNYQQTNGIQCIRHGSLFPYVGNAGDEVVYVCPTMARIARDKYKSSDLHSNVIRSYGMNASLQNNDCQHAMKYFSIKGGSRVMLFAEQGFIKQKGYQFALTTSDGNGWHDKELPDRDKGGKPGKYIKRDYRNFDACIDWRGKIEHKFDAGGTRYEHIGEYHGGRGHAVFCDGHVERVKYQDTAYICSGNWDNHKRIETMTKIDKWHLE